MSFMQNVKVLGLVRTNFSGNNTMSSLENNQVIDMIITVLAFILLFTTTITLGCTLEISQIKTHIKKPKGASIAIISQFIIMPVTAFSLSNLLSLSPIESITVLICGCCPGGPLSNLFTIILNGDVNLSITVTFCSNVAALGMMPLLLFIFSHGITGLKTSVPYVGIAFNILLTMIPCSIGVMINYYRPQYSPIVQKMGLRLISIVSVALLVLSGILVKDVIHLIFTPNIICVSALMPLIGYTMGYVLSETCGLSAKACATVSMETGCQNVQLCSAILQLNFTIEVIGQMILFPLLYIVFQSFEALTIIHVFKHFNRVLTQENEAMVQDEEEKASIEFL